MSGFVTRMIHCEIQQTPCNWYQECAFSGLTWGVYQGLYRKAPVDGTSPMPYVITNPSPNLTLSKHDTMFLLLPPGELLTPGPILSGKARCLV